MNQDEHGLEDEAYAPEREPSVSLGALKLHITVSHGRKKAENGGWISLGWSPVIGPKEPRQ